MKNIVITFIFIFAVASVSYAQQNEQTWRETRKEKRERQREEIRNLLENRHFVFRPTHALPSGGGSMYLNHLYDVEIKEDTLSSYLPFFGVAYQAEYGSRKSPLDFTQPLDNFRIEPRRKGFQVHAVVKNRMDHLTYAFFVSETGTATLNITSTNRQSISFNGRVEAPGDRNN